jgi:hypothetical protein
MGGAVTAAREVRMVTALALAWQILAAGQADAAWAVSYAARTHAVDADELALKLLRKLVAVQRARAAAAAVADADAALELDPAAHKAPRR